LQNFFVPVSLSRYRVDDITTD